MQWATEEVVSTGLQVGVASYVMGMCLRVKTSSIGSLDSHPNTNRSEAYYAHQSNMVPDSDDQG